jgi:hypothetical protein
MEGEEAHYEEEEGEAFFKLKFTMNQKETTKTENR